MARLKALGIQRWNLGSDVNMLEVQSSAMVLNHVHHNLFRQNNVPSLKTLPGEATFS